MIVNANVYHVFETVAGYCAIAWNDAGIVRLQLPASDATATERYLRRRLPGAQAGTPTTEVAEAIAAVKRYFMGQKVDFSDIRLDLGKQDMAMIGCVNEVLKAHRDEAIRGYSDITQDVAH